MGPLTFLSNAKDILHRDLKLGTRRRLRDDKKKGDNAGGVGWRERLKMAEARAVRAEEAARELRVKLGAVLKKGAEGESGGMLQGRCRTAYWQQVTASAGVKMGLGRRTKNKAAQGFSSGFGSGHLGLVRRPMLGPRLKGVDHIHAARMLTFGLRHRDVAYACRQGGHRGVRDLEGASRLRARCSNKDGFSFDIVSISNFQFEGTETSPGQHFQRPWVASLGAATLSAGSPG